MSKLCLTVPVHAKEQELLFKIVEQEQLYINFLPPTNLKYEKAPTLLLICGGGWHAQSRASILDMLHTLVSDLRASGFAVVASDYRVINATNNLTAKEQVTDLMDALRYLAHYADVLGIDPQRFIPSGHSAGAHLAMLVAHAPQNIFVENGFTETYGILACATLSTVTIIPNTPWTSIAAVNGVYDEELANLLSPYNHIHANNAPTLLIHGDMDYDVPFRHAQICIDKAMDIGARYDLLVCKGGNHYFVSSDNSHTVNPSLDEAMHITATWIRNIMDK